ncbi:type II toxin-antitoxin system Phd/YefM family antitoxin [Providencia rettgeri]|jgi:antitoxin StbD|uniref:type II toxin-antitoxin system Phd/YefM family antitoxin n=1 Tax=Providencia rettgeri TaxID=587 RepID=UPI00235FE9BE|nr:type II toxin-antitoxin system Phd/YefM family antitoxin [Providencia rettgeri]ELR5151404.1 type II toxin-antitoxin system Phd/YefM family antitoxin [Providencia rettgeri]MDR2227262.1 type II toxin-antitoxin system Phd/YefM family antitoxin [Providencia sp.]
MPQIILSDVTASISELKKNPMATVDSGEGFPVAILNRNKPAFYCVPAEVYENLLEQIEDKELIEIVNARKNQKLVDVDLDSYI